MSIRVSNPGQVEVLVSKPYFEGDSRGAIPLEYDSTVAKHAVDEIGRCRVQRDDLDAATERPLQISFEVELCAFERGRRALLEEHGDIDVTTGPGVAPGNAAEQVGDQDVRWSVAQEFAQPVLDLLTVRVHAASVAVR